MIPDEVREALAEYAHEAWSGWMKYMFEKGHNTIITSGDSYPTVWTMPQWATIRWRRQMNTPYVELPEEEKQSDREEADKILAIIYAYLAMTTQPVAPEPDWSQAPEWAMWATIIAVTSYRSTNWHWCWIDEKPSITKYEIVVDGYYHVGGEVDVPLGIDFRTVICQRPSAAQEGEP